MWAKEVPAGCTTVSDVCTSAYMPKRYPRRLSVVDCVRLSVDLLFGDLWFDDPSPTWTHLATGDVWDSRPQTGLQRDLAQTYWFYFFTRKR